MKVSTRGRYAMRVMLDVARNGGTQEPVSLGAVADRTGLSRGYLEHVAQSLRNARLLKAVSGRHGGYQLAAPVGEIAVRQILEASLGPFNVVDCVDDPESCPRSKFCECRVLYQMISNRITEVLENYTLGDLLDPDWVRRHGGSVDGVVPSPGGGCGVSSKQGAS